MLPSEYRMRRRSDFKRVYSKGRSFVSELVVLYVTPNTLHSTRVGFAASKKIGKAVARNRAKRVMREAVRENLSRLGSGYDLVVVGRRRTVEAKTPDVRAALEKALLKSGVVKPGDG